MYFSKAIKEKNHIEMYDRALQEGVQFYQFYDWVVKDIDKAKYSIDDLMEFRKTPRGSVRQPFKITTEDLTPKGSPNMKYMMQDDDFVETSRFNETEFNLQQIVGTKIGSKLISELQQKGINTKNNSGVWTALGSTNSVRNSTINSEISSPKTGLTITFKGKN